MAANQVKIIGSYLSPYVRKVLACLHLKGIGYTIDPIVPFFGSDEFSRVSPLRRIPVLIDGEVTLCDSTVICEYLDERYAGAKLLPADPILRARSRWLEEFADSRMGEVFIWHFYNQLVIRRFVWGQPPDAAVLHKAQTEEIPHVLDYLEQQLPVEGFLFGAIGLADIAIAAFFRNAAFARFEIDARRWPRVAAFVPRVLGHDALSRLQPFEGLCLKTPIAEHRSALKAAGAPVSDETFWTSTPRAGVLST